jgi:hypothetical protein
MKNDDGLQRQEIKEMGGIFGFVFFFWVGWLGSSEIFLLCFTVDKGPEQDNCISYLM